MKKTILALSLLAAGLSNPALAADTILKFVGTCDNALCRENGVDGTVPASVVASITLSDLSWVADGNAFAASFTAVKDFSYQGPNKFVRANNSGLVEDKVLFKSNSASATGITDFDITFADGAAYFAGDTTGFGIGGYFINVLGIPTPMNFESSTQAGQWAAASVPEPESYAMFLAGLGLIGMVARRRSRQK